MEIENELLVLSPEEEQVSSQENAFNRDSRIFVKLDPEITTNLESLIQGIEYSSIFTEKLVGVTKDQLGYEIWKDKDENVWVSWIATTIVPRYLRPISEVQDFIIQNPKINELLVKNLDTEVGEKASGMKMEDLYPEIGEILEKKRDQFLKILDDEFLKN